MWFVKAIGAPGSLPFLVLCCLAGLWMLRIWPQHRRVAEGWFIVVFGGYLILACPFVVTRLVDGLAVLHTRDVAQLDHVNTLVVMDGDNPIERVRLGLR